VTSRILIIHTPSQLEEASGLVDLLEASLSLPEDAIVCSSLPGYASSSRSGVGMGGAEFSALVDQLGAALALCDGPALQHAQLWFDAAAVWSRGKRLAVVIDAPELAAQLPSQLANAPAVVRTERDAVIGLIEDLAFDLGIDPRLGQDAQRALEQFSSFPPPAIAASAAPAVQASEPRQPEPSQSYEAVDTVPPPALVSDEVLEVADLEYDDGEEELYEVEDSEVEAIDPALAPRHSQIEAIEPRLTCEMSLAAGRALAECAFHRESGADFAAELEAPFGAFVDAAGGSWDELKPLGDIEVWLAATDNLLQALAGTRRDVCEWYEIGFQFATLRSIAEQGPPEDVEQRAVYQEMWSRSMAQLRTSAASAGVAPREIRRLQALLENLIGPEKKRDYGNLGRAVVALSEHAAAADRGELQMAGRAAAG
jgi:hypothetical protein